MKIVIFEMEDWEKAAFKQLGKEYEVLTTKRAVTARLNPRYKDADIISVFVYTKLTGDILKQFTGLKLIATRSTGYDHIDLDYCRRHNIAVSNAPRYGVNTVAEHVFAFIHAISRHIPESVERTRRGNFSQEGLQGFDLQGKTLGVIGTGEIGKNVIRIAHGYEMNIIAFDIRPDEAAASKLGFRYTDMDTLLTASDIITLHVPGIEKTRNMIAHQEFSRMKTGVIIINTARGFVINTQALLRALSEGKAAAAGLDVLPEESVIREEAELLHSAFTGQGNLQDLLAVKVIADMPNVVVTPHIAFNTREAVERLLDTSIGNIHSFIKGNPRNLVDKDK